MTMNSSGIFTRIRGSTSWQDDATNGIKILALRHDEHDEELAQALSLMICKDGRSTVTDHIPMNNHKITGLLNPTAGQDAATKSYIDAIQGWSTSKYISGSNANGRLNFTGPTGVNGIGWQAADLSWVARMSDANETGNRLVMNSTYASTAGADVFVIDETGRVNTSTGIYTHNLSWDGDEWRTINPGNGTLMALASNTLALSGLDTPTTADPYKPAPLREFARIFNSAGSAVLNLVKTASGDGNYLRSYVGSELRWELRFGDTTAESGSAYIGSDFALYRSDNAGALPVQALRIERATGNATFAAAIASSTGIISGATDGTVTIRPDGAASGTGELVIENGGDLLLSGDNIETKGSLFKLSTAVPGDIYLRPNGETNTGGQFRLEATGNVTVTGSATVDGSVTVSADAAGNTTLALKKAANTDINSIFGYTGAEMRWEMRLGDATGEGVIGTAYTGSDFTLTRYDNNGAVPDLVLSVTRDTGDVVIPHKLTVEGDPAVTTGNIAYTGTAAANVTFPIGTTLCVVTETTNFDRNAAVAVRLNTAGNFFYDISGAGALLTGTWRSRGAIIIDAVQNRYLVQRTA